MNENIPSAIEFYFNHSLYRYWQKRSADFFRHMRIVKSGIEKIPTESAAVLAPNHRNWKDIFLVAAMMSRPVAFAATHHLFDVEKCHAFLDGHFGQFLHGQQIQKLLHRLDRLLAEFIVRRVSRLGSIPVRSDKERYNFFQQARQILKQQKLLCIFPEGTLGHYGHQRRFKCGLSRVLLQLYQEHFCRIPVFPVGISGTEKFPFPYTEINFRIGSPIFLEQFLAENEKRTLRLFSDALQTRVQELLIVGSAYT